MSNYAYRLLKKLNFSERRILDVLPRMSIRSFDAGDVIWEKGSPVQSWYCVMSGYVAASVPLDSAGRMPVHIFGQHTWFGEQSILSRSTSAMEYGCLTPVEVIGMDKIHLEAAFACEPDFVRFLVGLVTWRVQQHSEMLMLMRLGSSSLRVVMGLAQLAEAIRHGQEASPAQNVSTMESVEIPIPQELIASLCGVSRTLFSEYLQHLARAGWVKVRYGAIELTSAETWRVFAQRQRESQRVVSRPSIESLLNELSAAASQVAGAQGDRQSLAMTA
jgi:CRP/FNR family cyclic AMP-dependent transcriptional regulator